MKADHIRNDNHVVAIVVGKDLDAFDVHVVEPAFPVVIRLQFITPQVSPVNAGLVAPHHCYDLNFDLVKVRYNYRSDVSPG